MSRHHDRRTPPGTSLVSAGVRLRLVTLAVGTVGTLGVGWSMRDSSASAEAAGRLGMRRVQSNMDDILGILALPMLLFFVILAVWSIVDLFRLYRVANDPERFRGKRRG